MSYFTDKLLDIFDFMVQTVNYLIRGGAITGRGK